MKQRKSGISLCHWLRENQKSRWAFLVGGIALTIICVYIFLLQPILCRFFITTDDIHQGVQYYHDRAFVAFESGETFIQLIQDTEFDKLGQVIDFYHVDNHIRDNPVYGKNCDVFALDIQMERDAFSRYRSEITSNSLLCGDLENFTLYLLYAFDSDIEKQGEIVLIAFDTKSDVARLILLTDKDAVTLTSGYISTLLNNSSMDWD